MCLGASRVAPEPSAATRRAISAFPRGTFVERRIDDNLYPKGVTVSDDEIEALNPRCDKFDGEWNYTISPTREPG